MENKPKTGSKSKPKLLVQLQRNNVFIILLVLSFVAFLFTRHVAFAITTGLFLVGVFVVDVLAGVQRHGLSKEVIELGVAIIIALVVWNGLSYALGTSSPVSAIVSCSMLPSYERGDMILLRGVPLDDIKAPIVTMTESEWSPVESSTHVPCGVFGPIEYICSQTCERKTLNGEDAGISQCATSIIINNQFVAENLENDVIVYAAPPNRFGLQGDIIHRVFAKINLTDSGRTLFIMKGDNNDLFDAVNFLVIDQESVKGKVLTRIPYLGFLKLFISGSFSAPAGCETVLQHQ